MFLSPYLQVGNVSKHKWIVDRNLTPNLIIHGIHIGLIHSHTLLCQRRCIVDGNVVQFWVLTPIFIWKKHRQQSLAQTVLLYVVTTCFVRTCCLQLSGIKPNSLFFQPIAWSLYWPCLIGSHQFHEIELKSSERKMPSD